MALQELSEKFGGTWKMESEENIAKYLEAMGVGFLMKKMASAMKPSMVIEVQGDEVVVTRKTPIKDLHSRHKLGEETDIVEHDRKYKSTMSFSDGKILINNVPADDKGKPNTLTREVAGDRLTQTYTVEDIVATVSFRKM